MNLLSREIKKLINKLEYIKNDKLAIFIKNTQNKINQQKHRFDFDPRNQLFYVTEENRKQYFANRTRGFYLYEKGIEVRSTLTAHSYLLHTIDISKGDIVVDCGANYADLFLWFKDKINPQDYITFEPGIEEFKVISANAPQSMNNNLGLSNESKTTKFYLNSQDADSSIVEPTSYTNIVEITTTTLSQYVKENNIQKIKLFKLEAEGFEPEILEGSKDILDLIEYIAIDGGYERGIEQEETFSHLTNVLIKNGFEMIGVNLYEGRALFQRQPL